MNNFVILYSDCKNRSNLFKYVQSYCRKHPGNGYNEVSGNCKINGDEFFIQNALIVQNMSVNDAINISKKLGSDYVLSSDAYGYNCGYDVDGTNMYDFSFDGNIKYPGGYNKNSYYKEIKI